MELRTTSCIAEMGTFAKGAQRATGDSHLEANFQKTTFDTFDSVTCACQTNNNHVEKTADRAKWLDLVLARQPSTIGPMCLLHSASSPPVSRLYQLLNSARASRQFVSQVMHSVDRTHLCFALRHPHYPIDDATLVLEEIGAQIVLRPCAIFSIIGIMHSPGSQALRAIIRL